MIFILFGILYFMIGFFLVCKMDMMNDEEGILMLLLWPLALLLIILFRIICLIEEKKQ